MDDGDGASELVDLQRRRLARELENELGGLFGIEARDIEAAIARVWQAIDSGEFKERYGEPKLPPRLRRALTLLDSLYAEALQAQQEGDAAALRQMAQLLQSYSARLERLADSEPLA